MYSVHEVADFFLSQPDRESGDTITHLKLQKLCYYAQAWYLAINGERFIEGSFEAWPHGPVHPDLWNRFRDKNWQPIMEEETITQDYKFDEEDLGFLEIIWNIYGPYTAKGLEDMTHDELPWQEARRGLQPYEASNRVISDDTMKLYYAARAAS
jgi:uncharacterized phage-associated protein